jgi:hypothetical protein
MEDTMKNLKVTVKGRKFNIGFDDDSIADAVFNSLSTTVPDGIDTMHLGPLSPAEAKGYDRYANFEVKDQHKATIHRDKDEPSVLSYI